MCGGDSGSACVMNVDVGVVGYKYGCGWVCRCGCVHGWVCMHTYIGDRLCVCVCVCVCVYMLAFSGCVVLVHRCVHPVMHLVLSRGRELVHRNGLLRWRRSVQENQ